MVHLFSILSVIVSCALVSLLTIFSEVNGSCKFSGTTNGFHSRPWRFNVIHIIQYCVDTTHISCTVHDKCFRRL